VNPPRRKPAPAARLRAFVPDALLPDAHTLLLEHALVVEAGRVAAVVPRAELHGIPVVRMAGELWVPAPVLAHAHLESWDAPSGLWPRETFAEWVRYLLAWRESPDRIEPERAALESLRELEAAGCGLVVCHVGEPRADGTFHDDLLGEEAPRLPEVLALPELFGPAPEEAPALLARLDARPPAAWGGYALHAPYSVSEELARGVFARSRGWSVPVSIHLGEHPEERALLACGEGPLADLLRERGRPLKRSRWPSPVDWLQEVGGLQPGTVAVHGTDLDREEQERLARAGVPLVWCPGTHLYFDRPRPAFGEDGLPLPALGCDSRASNTCLDPLRELRLALALVPGPGPRAWWRALTEGGARAFGREDLGHLRPGALPRILRMPWRPADDALAVCDRLSADASWHPLGPVLEL